MGETVNPKRRFPSVPLVVADDPDTPIPVLDWNAKRLLNRQTAFNHDAVLGCERCGCFHCGSIFPGSDVTQWREEDCPWWVPTAGETPWPGAAPAPSPVPSTALCPYCDVDAVITGTPEFPVSTALLSLLYMEWFKEEFREREKKAAYVPDFSGHDDYLRKGIPFRLESAINEQAVGEIRLFPTRVFDPSWGNMHDNEVFSHAMDVIRQEAKGGVVSARAYFDHDGYYVAEFINDAGERLPYEPWTDGEQDLLLELTRTYGNQLKGIVRTTGSGQMMTLFVTRALR